MAVFMLLTAAGTPALAESEQSLAKESQNPVGDIISVPFENNVNFGVGPKDAEVYVLNLKPVYPIQVGEFNLISRFILPIVYQGERFHGEGSQSGLGNLTYQGFFSPAKPGKVIWGAGPALAIPTNTDNRLDSDKWSAGPAVVVLAKPGRWLFGALAQHFWSFAGDSDEDSINLSSFQYFVNYNLDNGWYLSSTPTMIADWEANSSNRYFVPVGGGAGRLLRFGQQPVDFKLQGFWNAEKPKGAADWSLQFQVKLLFPQVTSKTSVVHRLPPSPLTRSSQFTLSIKLYSVWGSSLAQICPSNQPLSAA